MGGTSGFSFGSAFAGDAGSAAFASAPPVPCPSDAATPSFPAPDDSTFTCPVPAGIAAAPSGLSPPSPAPLAAPAVPSPAFRSDPVPSRPCARNEVSLASAGGAASGLSPADSASSFPAPDGGPAPTCEGSTESPRDLPAVSPPGPASRPTSGPAAALNPAACVAPASSARASSPPPTSGTSVSVLAGSTVSAAGGAVVAPRPDAGAPSATCATAGSDAAPLGAAVPSLPSFPSMCYVPTPRRQRVAAGRVRWWARRGSDCRGRTAPHLRRDNATDRKTTRLCVVSRCAAGGAQAEDLWAVGRSISF